MASSFRDPDGSVVTVNNRVLRFVNRSGERNLNAFLATETARQALAAGQIVSTYQADLNSLASLAPADLRALDQGDADRQLGAVLEHERIAFQSFPYEWAPEMLYAAGVLTLDLAEAALTEGFGLKDATPYNILFRAGKPVFVDLLSFEKRDPADPIWLPYAQFVRTFILPLLAAGELGLRLDQIFLTRRDGLEPEEVYRLCSPARRMRRPFLTLASIPTWLAANSDSGKDSVYKQHQLTNADQAAFVLERLFRRLRHQLGQAKPRRKKTSTWSDYMASVENFPPNYLWEKEIFLREALSEFKPGRLLDVGCNTGHFSLITARAGTSVVAVDQDPTVIGELWRQAAEQKLDILALVVDLTRPSPGVGWRNSENQSFLERSRSSFDAVLMLALVHHLMVGERIPLAQILSLAAELTSDLLIVEFVAPADPMFRRLLRGRAHLFEGLSNEEFRAACLKDFNIVRSRQLAQTDRWIYLLRKKWKPANPA
jgi:2-polyprenyl-3-methyl-5-hydroxy-6-metoxy-1,4-benzoquinol methylase